MTPSLHQLAAALRTAIGAGQSTPRAIQTTANAHPEVSLTQLQKAFAAAAADPNTSVLLPLRYKRLR